MCDGMIRNAVAIVVYEVIAAQNSSSSSAYSYCNAQQRQDIKQHQYNTAFVSVSFTDKQQ
jgi:hypothetical protein